MLKFKRIWAIYVAGFLLAVHYALISYLNSSLLTGFVGNSGLGILFIIGSILSLVALFISPALLRRFGNVTTILIFASAEIFAVFGMGSLGASIPVILLFLLQQAAESAIYFCLDIELEEEIKTEGTTGSKRGIFLTAQNIAWVLSPLALTFITQNQGFSSIYFLSGIALIPLILISVLIFNNTKKIEVKTAFVLPALKNIFNQGDKGRIIATQFFLNFFYAWMLIYLPLLLSKELGFSWEKIGFILTIMLLPFLLIELPAGIIADKKLGEKEILVLGFLILGVSTLLIPFIKSQLFLAWALSLFITRIGASLVEIGGEAYFFKQVDETDTGLISLFRMVRPFSFIVAPLFGIIVLQYLSYSQSFIFLGLFTLLGLLFIPKVDTR